MAMVRFPASADYVSRVLPWISSVRHVFYPGPSGFPPWKIKHFRYQAVFQYKIAACCDGVHQRGQIAPKAKPRAPFASEGVQNAMDTSYSMQQLFCYTLVTLLFLFSKFCCHLQILFWWIHSLISRRTVQIRNNSSLFPWTRKCFIHSAGNLPTLGTIKVMYTVVYITFHVTRPPSDVTYVYVLYRVIGSRPIKFVTEV